MSEKKIKVLMVVSNLRPSNGVSSYAMNYFRKLDHDSVQMDFAVYKQHDNPYDDEIKANGGRVFVLPNIRNDFINHCKACKKLLRNERYDIVHDNTMLVSYPLMKYAKKYSPVRILHSHNSKLGETPEKEKRNRFFLPLLLNCSNYFAACSDLAAKAMFKDSDYKFVPNLINNEVFHFNEQSRSNIRTKHNCNNKTIIITVGRIAVQKNPLFAFDVFDLIADKIKDVEYWWVGSGHLDKDAAEYIKNLNNTDKIKLLGSRNDIPDLLQAADLFFLPSLFEGLPVTCVEAQAMGLPCIVSDTITDEMVYTDLVEFISLSNSKEDWADHIINRINSGYKRRSYSDELFDSPFSDLNAGINIESYYRSLLKQVGSTD